MRSKLDTVSQDLNRIKDEALVKQKKVSEQTALMANCHQSALTLKAQRARLEDGCVSKVRSIIDSIRENYPRLVVEEKSPEHLLGVLNDLLDTLDQDASLSASAVRAVMKKLKKLVCAPGLPERPCCVLCPTNCSALGCLPTSTGDD